MVHSKELPLEIPAPLFALESSPDPHPGVNFYPDIYSGSKITHLCMPCFLPLAAPENKIEVP